jgi:hypothetical protein
VSRLVLVAALVAGCGGSPDAALPYGSRAEDCGSCHADHFAEWSQSSHARSADSPVRAALMPHVERAWGSFARSRCDGCHAPGHGGDAGIGCTTCHAAIGNHAERDGELAVDLEEPIAGPLADPAPTPAHATRPGEFLASPSLCGTCHEVTGPGLFVEPTLTEWRASPQAAIGQTCLDCHMPTTADRPLTTEGTRARPSRSHRFVGFDPIWDAPPEEAAVAAEETRALLAAALSLEAARVDGGVEVVVTNVGAGHGVPTGATFLRDLWVDLEMEGVVVASRVVVIGDQPMRDGVPVALPTEADSIEHHALAPGAEARAIIEGAATEAVLRGSAVKREVLSALDLDELADRIPTHEIARVLVGD